MKYGFIYERKGIANVDQVKPNIRGKLLNHSERERERGPLNINININHMLAIIRLQIVKDVCLCVCVCNTSLWRFERRNFDTFWYTMMERCQCWWSSFLFWRKKERVRKE